MPDVARTQQADISPPLFHSLSPSLSLSPYSPFPSKAPFSLCDSGWKIEKKYLQTNPRGKKCITRAHPEEHPSFSLTLQVTTHPTFGHSHMQPTAGESPCQMISELFRDFKNPVHGHLTALGRTLVVLSPNSVGGFWISFNLSSWDPLCWLLSALVH